MPHDTASRGEDQRPMAVYQKADGSIVRIPMSIDPGRQTRDRAAAAEERAATLTMMMEQAVAYIEALEKDLGEARARVTELETTAANAVNRSATEAAAE